VLRRESDQKVRSKVPDVARYKIFTRLRGAASPRRSFQHEGIKSGPGYGEKIFGRVWEERSAWSGEGFRWFVVTATGRSRTY
jgi:hypothetical protein